MEKAALLALADRLENAAGPARALDNEIARCLEVAMPADPAEGPPAYTSSLDACRALHQGLTPDFDWFVFTDCGACFGRLERHEDVAGWVRYGPEANVETPELAWLSGILRATAAALS